MQPSQIGHNGIQVDKATGGTSCKTDIIKQLQTDILSLQGFKKKSDKQQIKTGLGIIEQAFPSAVFPTGVIHEFISNTQEASAATNGFITALLSRLIRQKGVCLWISTNRTVYPPALMLFGINPDRIVFIDLKREKEALWAIEEALKCTSLSVVIGEIPALQFKQSRRLQLAVEASKVTGFIHCYQSPGTGSTASVSRWMITPIASSIEEGMPGVGFPCWNIKIAKIRNGKPGTWQLQWADGNFMHLDRPEITALPVTKQKAG